MESLDDLRYRFLGKVKRNQLSGCLEWQRGFLKGKPYGQFWWGKVNGGPENMQAHRAAWLLFKGPIPDGMMVLHKCNNGACCETEAEGHLYLGTHVRNMRDRDEAGRTSKWDHRYNFKRNPELITKIKDLLPTGKSLQVIADELGIGRQTIYRARDQDPELKEMIKATKTLRYSNANRIPGRKRRGQ